MHRICYMSRAGTSLGSDLADIVAVSRRRNAADNVTGLLLSDGYRFLQAIEGEEDAVRACFARIERDGRHHNLTVVSDEAVDRREFGSWSMQHRDSRALREAFRNGVAEDVAAVADLPLKAMFIGFAALSR